MFDLLSNPDVQKLIGGSSTLAFILGIAVKMLLPMLRGGLKNEHEMACEALQKALKTADPKDDAEAQKRIDAVRRIRALVDSLPAGKR